MADWKWYAGRNEEHLTIGPCDTREEAFEEAQMYFEDEGFHLMEGQKDPVSLGSFFDVERFLEDANEETYDLQGEDAEPLFELNTDQERALAAAVRQAIDTVMAQHGREFLPFLFSNQRNEEYIDGK